MQVESRCLQPKGKKPGPIIVQAAKKEKAHLIVLGTRGMNAICRAVIGSVSDYVLHNAPCPVTICRKFREQKFDKYNEDEDMDCLNATLDEDDEFEDIPRDVEQVMMMTDEQVMTGNDEQVVIRNDKQVMISNDEQVMKKNDEQAIIRSDEQVMMRSDEQVMTGNDKRVMMRNDEQVMEDEKVVIQDVAKKRRKGKKWSCCGSL